MKLQPVQAPCKPTLRSPAPPLARSIASFSQNYTQPKVKTTFSKPDSNVLLQLGSAGALCAAALLVQVEPAAASVLQSEPANALSLPTWAIHVSSVVEWMVAMSLIWQYADISGNQRWKGLTWGMLPALGSAMCACTWHFFYNSPSLEYLVALQAFLTVVGNATCMVAAYRIWQGAKTEAST